MRAPELTRVHNAADTRRMSGVLLLLLTGCAANPADWPAAPLVQRQTAAESLLSYDVNGDGRAEYSQVLREGRKVALQFDDNGDGRPDEEVRWDAPDAEWPHYLIVLDGVPYSLIDTMWKEGRFRLFPPPSRVISVFPSMTDLALTRLCHTGPCIAIEGQYLDRARNKLSNGTAVLTSGKNSPWIVEMDYHLPADVAARVYLDPKGVFKRELRDMKRVFDRVRTGFVTGYSVGSAGLGTRGGEEAIREYMADIDDFCERLVYERRGRVRLSISADHGHTLVPAKRVGYKSHLEPHGFRITTSLKRPRDVVEIKYGLITVTAFYTREAAELAEALVSHEATDLVVYAQDQQVLVLGRAGRGVIGKGGGGFTYAVEGADPLGIAAHIERLRREGQVSAGGVIDDRALFEATAEHHYPDPLHRIWDCFHGLLLEPPDVIVSLKDGYCHGYWMLEVGIGKVASTHGSLNALNSNAFLLSSAAPLPPAMRIEEVLPTIEPPREPSQTASAQP